MMKIVADVNVTRRQNLHYVFDEHEEIAWTGRDMGKLFEWLYENGAVEAELHTEHNKFIVSLRHKSA